MSEARRDHVRDTDRDRGDAHPGGERDADNGNGFDFLGDEELHESLFAAESQLRETLARHPVPLLLGALAAGYVIARLVRGADS